MGEICDSRKDWDNIKKQSCTSNEHFGINTDSSNEVGAEHYSKQGMEIIRLFPFVMFLHCPLVFNRVDDHRDGTATGVEGSVLAHP